MDRTKFGAIPSEYDARDYSVKMARAVTFPDEYEQPDVDIYDQGSIGNCVMQAISAVIHNHYYFKLAAIVGSAAAKAAMKKLFGVEVEPTQTNTEFGRTFGYGHWRDDGYNGQGMHPNIACNGLVRDGIPPLSIDNKLYDVPEAISYANSNLAKMLKAAASFKGWTWARVYTVDEIKATLKQGIRCVVCLPYVSIQNGNWLVKGAVGGYHEMMIMGWHKATGFRVRNSWGKSSNGGSLAASKDGYVNVAFEDIFACNDVIALFPPVDDTENLKEEIAVVRTTLRLKSPYMRDKDTRMGKDVTYCQQRLTAHNFPCGTIDGIFGRKCDVAVRAFQRANGLVADGIVGVKTWAALDKDPSGKAARFIAWLKGKVGDIYVWGGQGETDITEAWIRKKETSSSNAKRVIALWKKRQGEGRNPIAAYDCSGLIVAWLLSEGLIPGDLSSRGLWRMCTGITRAELVPGDLLFRKNILGVVHHVGVYIGDGEVIEARGREYGVVQRGINASGADYWTDCGRLGVLK